MIRSSIDLGTNTCLLLIGEVEGEAGNRALKKVIGDYSTIVRLGKGVDQNRMLDPQAMERTLSCLKGYSEKVRAAGGRPEETVAVATSQARDARNGADFFATVEAETGFRFQIISGDDEARFSFLGALLPGMNPSASAVIDIGGGSTELIAEEGGKSIDVGCVRFTERYLKSDPVTDDEFWACQEEIDRMLQDMVVWRRTLPADIELVAVAGTATSLAAYHLGLPKFEAAAIDNLTVTRGDIHRMVEELKWRTIDERCALPGMERERADVLLAGSMILWRSMELLDFRSCRISTRGLRYGALLHK